MHKAKKFLATLAVLLTTAIYISQYRKTYENPKEIIQLSVEGMYLD